MNFKIIGYIAAILLILAVSVGIGWKLIQKSESQKAHEIVNYNYDFHPLFGIAGCARYMAPEKMLTDARPKANADKNINSTK
jgi:hypothetical protein